MNRSSLLKSADELINGDRAKDYGDAYQNHDKIAIAWNVIAKSALARILYAHARRVDDGLGEDRTFAKQYRP